MTDNYDDLQRVVENLAVTDGLTVVLNLLPGNKLSVASRMWSDAQVVLPMHVLEVRVIDGRIHLTVKNNRQCTRSRLRRR
jgi:hypothetical protein